MDLEGKNINREVFSKSCHLCKDLDGFALNLLLLKNTTHSLKVQKIESESDDFQGLVSANLSLICFLLHMILRFRFIYIHINSFGEIYCVWLMRKCRKWMRKCRKFMRKCRNLVDEKGEQRDEQVQKIGVEKVQKIDEKVQKIG